MADAKLEGTFMYRLIKDTIGEQRSEEGKEVDFSYILAGHTELQKAVSNPLNTASRRRLLFEMDKWKEQESTEQEVGRLLELLDKDIEENDLDPEEFVAYRDMVKNVLTKNSSAEFKFIINFVKGNGFLNPKTFNLFKRIYDGRDFALPVTKTGSRLTILARMSKPCELQEVIFANEIDDEGVNCWYYTRRSGVPVSPILQEKEIEGRNRFRVFTRYSGPVMSDIYKMLDSVHANTSWSESEFLEMEKYGEYLEDIKRSLVVMHRALTKQLENLHIDHGHLHQGNITVELVRSKYFDSQMDRTKNINEIPYDPESFSFDFTDFLRDPYGWVLVPRIIDWDAARFTTEIE